MSGSVEMRSMGSACGALRGLPSSPESGPASGGKARTVGCQNGWMMEILFDEDGRMVRVDRGS